MIHRFGLYQNGAGEPGPAVAVVDVEHAGILTGRQESSIGLRDRARSRELERAHYLR